MHGAASRNRSHKITRGTFDVEAGSLFLTLHRLEQQGWLLGEWSVSPTNAVSKLAYFLLRADDS